MFYPAHGRYRVPEIEGDSRQPRRSTRARISSALQAVVRGPSFTGLGKHPVRHPSHHVLLLTGIRARTWDRRRNPVLGMMVDITHFFCWITNKKCASLDTVGQKKRIGLLQKKLEAFKMCVYLTTKQKRSPILPTG